MRQTEVHRSLRRMLKKAGKNESHRKVTLSQPHLSPNTCRVYRVRTSSGVALMRQESEAVVLPWQPLIGPTR